MLGLLVLALGKIFLLVRAREPSAVPEIKSGYAGYCMDDRHDSTAQGAAVILWDCNGTQAQKWTMHGATIVHGSDICLTAGGVNIVVAPCNGAADQEWAAAIDGLENPDTAQCLAAPRQQSGVQLTLASCGSLTQPSEAWQTATWSRAADTTAATTVCSGTEGQLVACYAAKEWAARQASDHNQLLNLYTDGNGYEEWCADFVSYVYKEAGYPFSAGERDSWDEYLATNVQNMGFVYHDASSGYVPRTGDVAFFDYSGGHVEIVAIGGSKPLFIYGDSGTIDPVSGNGDMAENTITNDGAAGQVLYYLSP